jgi:alkylhydroperoxidase family enzyme
MGWPAPLSDAECWKLLPLTIKGTEQPLPTWARILARELPKGTAAFLELDRAQRTAGPVDPVLRAAMRWTAAHANRCDYAKQTAAADAFRAGVSQEKWAALEQREHSAWTHAELAAIEFAHAMTVDSDGYPDSKFARLVELFDERQAAAMVLHMAYANFQDRLLIGLGAPLEEGGPLPPPTVVFDPSAFVIAMPKPGSAPSGPPPQPAPSKGEPDSINDESPTSWLPYPELQVRLEQQRRRATRLRIPEWNEFAGKLPEGLMEKPSDIIWYRIAFGYAHELAVPFEIYMRTAGLEIGKNWDRIFGGSLFWIVTDAMKCPYCMGHCEMNWEVAGLSVEKISHRSEVLAGNDWSIFSKPEQQALDFARRLTKTPWAVTRADIDRLRAGFGDQRAMFTLVNSSRYNYMTRISNGFQLTLESRNVFWDYYNQPKPASGGASR